MLESLSFTVSFLLAAVKIFDQFYGLTASGEAAALTHELEQFDIYSNSWGPSDNGEIFETADDVVHAALLKGVTEVQLLGLYIIKRFIFIVRKPVFWIMVRLFLLRRFY